jgi:hypothetical protein
MRNFEWRDNESVTKACVDINPGNGVLWSNLAHVEHERGNLGLSRMFDCFGVDGVL